MALYMGDLHDMALNDAPYDMVGKSGVVLLKM
jgi:hypothetical protein